MKTIAAAAMAAIEAGEAIVTGAVEIIPLGLVNYTTVGITDLDAVANCGGSAADAMTAGITLTGFAPTDLLRLTLPTGELFTAWNFEGGISGGWLNEFDVVPDGIAANSVRLSERGATPTATSNHSDAPGGYATATDAQSAFGTQFLTGASEYTFWIKDTAPGGGSGAFDNSGGVSILVERGIAVGSAETLRVWGGHWPIDIGGNPFKPVGARGLVQQGAGAIGGIAQGLQIGLSGIEAAIVDALDDAEQYKGASVVIYQMIFAGDGKTLLDSPVFDRGRIDAIGTEEVVGAAASILAAVESAARGLGRSGARMRSDSDQRLITGAADDGYFKHTAYAGQKTLYWGGKKPAISGGALTSGGGSSGGSIGSGGISLIGAA